MKVTLDQLKKMLATYRLRVLHVQPAVQGYVVETNKGKKRITVWENAELLKWSNAWREELFKQGNQDAERFLLNGNKKRYIRYQGKYFVLTHFPEGRSPDPANEAECRSAGECFARFHSALDRVDHGSRLTNTSRLNEAFFTEGSTTIKQVMQKIEQKTKPALVDEVVYSNLPLLYKRFRRAYQLWDGVKDAVGYFPLSFAAFSLEQFKETRGGWIISGGYNQPLASLHQDTVHVLRQIYEQSDWDLSKISAFLDGYEKQRKLTDNELVYVLTQLAVPWEVWHHFAGYLMNADLPEDRVTQLTEAILRQRYWDELSVYLGKYIDRRNEASA